MSAVLDSVNWQCVLMSFVDEKSKWNHSVTIPTGHNSSNIKSPEIKAPGWIFCMWTLLSTSLFNFWRYSLSSYFGFHLRLFFVSRASLLLFSSVSSSLLKAIMYPTKTSLTPLHLCLDFPLSVLYSGVHSHLCKSSQPFMPFSSVLSYSFSWKFILSLLKASSLFSWSSSRSDAVWCSFIASRAFR